MALAKSGVIRGVVMLAISAVVVTVFMSRSTSRSIPTSDTVGLFEVLALIAPFLWIDKSRRWILILAVEFLIWLGFRSIQTLIEREYLYSSGFALCCAVCTGMLVHTLRRRQTGGPGLGDEK